MFFFFYTSTFNGHLHKSDFISLYCLINIFITALNSLCKMSEFTKFPIKLVPLCILLFKHIYLFTFRERESEGEKHHCVVASHMPPIWDLAFNPGMCPDWELNWQPFGSQAGTQSTELHKPEPLCTLNMTTINLVLKNRKILYILGYKYFLYLPHLRRHIFL